MPQQEGSGIQFQVRKMTEQKKFEHVLGVFAGVEEPEGIKEIT